MLPDLCFRAPRATARPISQVGAFSDCFGGHKNLWESLVASAATHGPLQCAGVRKILEVVPEGGFEKLRMAPNYEWMTYSEYFKTADSLGAGLAEAIPGLKANDTVVIYADTQRDWMLAAYACWRQGYVVGTIYATLGAEGAEYGINQSGCKAHAPPVLHLALRAALTALAAPRRRRLTRRSPLPRLPPSRARTPPTAAHHPPHWPTLPCAGGRRRLQAAQDPGGDCS